MQNQRIRLRVGIKKVTMNIKFPCSLAIQLKHGKTRYYQDTSQDYRKIYQLKNGQCLIGQMLESQVEAIYNTTRSRYQEKKIAINIFMVSPTGKVAAGSISFSLFGKQPGNSSENVQFLQKCPDKQAKIYYSLAIDVLKKIQGLDKTVISEGPKKRSVYDSIQLAATERTPKKEGKIRGDFSPRHHEIKQSLVEDILMFDKSPSYKNQIREKVQNNRYKLTEHLKTEINARVRRSKSNKHKQQKIQTKTLSPAQKIKAQIYSNQDFQQSEELLKLKSRLRYFENNEKSYAQSLREFKQELQRRKNKINQLQSGKVELQEFLKSKQDKIKKLEKQVKENSEQFEATTNQFRIMKTQLQIKQNINKEQIKKLEEKYRQSELQRQKITEQYNRSLKTFEENQKKYQNLMKQKDKSIIEEKNKVNKKIDLQNNNLSDLQRQRKQMQCVIQELNKDKRVLTNAKSELQAKLSSTIFQNQSISSKLKANNQKINQLQRQIQALKVSETEKQQYKKKLSEAQILITNLTEKINVLEKNYKTSEQKIIEIQHQLHKRLEEKSQLSLKFNQLKKSHQNTKFNEEQKAKQSKSLAQINNTANYKISDLKNKLQTERRSLQQLQRQYEDRYIFITNQKNSLATQASQLRWEVEKHISANNQLSLHLKTHNQDIFRLSQTIIQKEERIKQLEQVVKQATVSNQYLAASSSELQKKKKELQSQLKQQGLQLSQLKKKHQKSQRDFADSKERIKSLEISLKQKVNELQKKIKEKDEAFQIKNTIIQSLQFQQKSALDEMALIKQAATAYQKQIIHLRETISNNRKQLQNQQALILKLKVIESDSKKIISEKQHLITVRDKEIEQLTKNISKINEENSEYRNSCVISLEKYFQQLLKDNESLSVRQNFIRINAYPNQRISSLQIEYVQKILQNATKIRHKIGQVYQQKQIIQFENQKTKLQLQQSGKRAEQQLLRQRQRVKMLNQQIMKHEESQKLIIQKHQQLLSGKEKQIQHFKAYKVAKQEQSYELKAQIHILISQFDTLKEDNRQLQDKVLLLRSQQIKGKAQLQAKSQETACFYQQQIQQLKLTHIQYQKKIASLEKDLAEKLQSIKKYEIEQSGIVYQCDKRQNRINELSDRLRESQASTKQAERIVRQKQRQLKKILQNLEHVSNSVIVQKEKHEQTLYKLQQHSHLILALNKQLEQSKEETNAEQVQTSQNYTQLKLRFESLKNENLKLLHQVKQLKEKIILLSSEIQLKKFMTTQLQNNANIQKELKQELKNQLQKKRQQIHKQTEQISISKLKARELQQKLTSIEEDKDSLVSANEKLKQNISQIRMSSRQDRQSGDQIAQLQKQVSKFKLQKRQLEEFYQRQITEVKSSFKESKRTQTSRISRQEQLKKKLKSAEKLLESTHPDLALERSRFMKETQRDKRQLINKIQSLESQIQQLQSQVTTIKQRNKRQNDRLSSQLSDLRQESNTKDFFIRNQQLELENINSLLNQALSGKQKVENQLNNQKAKFRKLQQTLQSQQKDYKEKIKKIQEEEVKNVATEIQKKITSSKFKRLNMNFNEVQKMMLSGYYREIEDIISSTIKEKRY